MQKKTILVADDVEINRDMLRVIFEKQYDILEAADGEEAIREIRANSAVLSAIFLDFMMPNKSGLDVLDYMRRHKYMDRIPVIMITGETTVESDVKAYEYGASDIIYKPFEPRVVIRRAKNLIELFEHRTHLETLLTERTEALRRSEEKLRKNNDFLINSLSTVVEFRNLESGTHIQRVKLFTGILLAHVKQQYPQYHLTEEQIEMITGASTLHDIGKIAIFDRILLKPGKLTESEMEEMKKHTVYGCRLLEKCHQEDSEFYKYCYEICRWHHERADGRGYPDGLSEKEIPIWAQVVSIADVFDALVSRRVYKPAYDVQEAVWMIRRGECGQFSDAIMDCFALAKEELVAAAFGEAREPVTEG